MPWGKALPFYLQKLLILITLPLKSVTTASLSIIVHLPNIGAPITTEFSSSPVFAENFINLAIRCTEEKRAVFQHRCWLNCFSFTACIRCSINHCFSRFKPPFFCHFICIISYKPLIRCWNICALPSITG